MPNVRERGSHRTFLLIEKWDEEQVVWARRRSGLWEPAARDFHAAHVRPYETLEHEGNLVTDAGWNLLMKNVAGTPGTLFSATVGRIGVGISTTAVAYTDTDLNAAAGSSNRQFKLISAAPTVGATHAAGLAFQATFGTGQANFLWAEFGTDQGTSDGTTVVGVLFNHGIAGSNPTYGGTKASGQVWAATETITWS